MILTGLGAFILASVVCFVIAGLLRRHGNENGLVVALPYLVLAIGAAIRIGIGTSRLVRHAERRTSLLGTSLGVFVAAILSAAGVVIGLIVGLLASQGGVVD